MDAKTYLIGAAIAAVAAIACAIIASRRTKEDAAGTAARQTFDKAYELTLKTKDDLNADLRLDLANAREDIRTLSDRLNAALDRIDRLIRIVLSLGGDPDV